MSDEFDFGEANIRDQELAHYQAEAQKRAEVEFNGRLIKNEAALTGSQLENAQKTNNLLPTLAGVDLKNAKTEQNVNKHDEGPNISIHDESSSSSKAPIAPIQEPALPVDIKQLETLIDSQQIMAATIRASKAAERTEAAIRKVEAAVTKAEAASTKAEAASTKAEAASTKAEAASTKAEAAAEKAEKAVTRLRGEEKKGESSDIKQTASTAEIYSKEELQSGMKQIFIVEKGAKGKNVLIPFNPNHADHHAEYQNHRIFKVTSEGQYSGDKELIADLHKGGPLYIRKEDGTEVEIDKGKIREFTPDEREEVNNLFKQYNAQIGFKIATPTASQGKTEAKSQESEDNRAATLVAANRSKKTASKEDDEQIKQSSSQTQMNSPAQLAERKRLEQQNERLTFNASIKKLRVAGERKRKEILDHKLENIKEKLLSLNEREYDNLKQAIIVQENNMEEITAAIRNLNNLMQELGAPGSEKNQFTNNEMDYLASEIIRMGIKEESEFIVVFEDFLNTSLESRQEGGHETQKRAVLESKVSRVMVSIMGPSR